MCRTNDGFELAEADLKMRGPGDFEGTRQSGLAIDLHIADLSRDSSLMEMTRSLAVEILEQDPDLSQEQNRLLAEALKNQKITAKDYSKIS
ncbi:MAG: hypothetical protein HUJ91_02560 [Bacteroidales bacterium]|nr:hypothetical protein [Bacteroidales bacterium]